MIVSIPLTCFGLGRSIRSGRLYFALYLECLFRVLRIVKGPDVLVIMNSRPHEIKGSRIKWVMLHSHREHFFVTGAVAVATEFHTISHLFPFLKGKWPFRVSGLRASCCLLLVLKQYLTCHSKTFLNPPSTFRLDNFVSCETTLPMDFFRVMVLTKQNANDRE